MKFHATIFVEGDSDKNFLHQYVEEIFGVSIPSNQLIETGGKDNLSKFRERFVQSSDQGFSNLVIFDSDSSMDSKRQALMGIKNSINVEFDYFLFPNNKDSGNFEILLENIINPEKKFIVDCFSEYIDCLEGNKLKLKLNLPAQKTKIYAFLDLLFAETKISKRNFKDQNLWDLRNPYLEQLKVFLTKHIKS